MAVFVPHGPIHSHLQFLAQGEMKRLYSDERVAYQISKNASRADRRNQFEAFKRNRETQLPERAKLAKSTITADQDYIDINVDYRITELGREALLALNAGYVWDGKHQQKSFRLTVSYYVDELGQDRISDITMQAASRLPDRYKQVHKLILLRQIFFKREKDHWVKIL